MSIGGGFVIEVDISSYFDNIPRSRLRAILDQRVRDESCSEPVTPRSRMH
jgi:hypothetical protein